MKIVISGGHHNSALAVVGELNKLGRHQYLWLGHRHSVWGDTSDSAEYKEVTAYGIPFVDLKAGKLYKTFNPVKLIRLPRGLFNAFYHLLKFKPDRVLSFGGYLAAPVALAAWVLQIPVFTHEQTSVVGWSNRLIGKLARQVFVTWPESAKYFPRDKVVVTGLPLRKELINLKPNQEPRTKNQDRRIYITGGKQGSDTINQVVKEALPELLKQYHIIHQCGAVSFLDSKVRLKEAVSHLPENLQKNYQVDDYFYAQELAKVLERAGFVICRGGAHTIYEMAYLAKPCIVIPIPWVSHQEQLKNAQILQKAGSAIILEEKDLNAHALLKTCLDLKKNYSAYQTNALDFANSVKDNAATQIAQAIL
ncbi:MAG: UDP-N-acetylglucosamine--N-acetylmuramyl-(pentapeptide) pyrophosphoryl-undecaprenol N-acetylglucosamine transferase [bacterium]